MEENNDNKTQIPHSSILSTFIDCCARQDRLYTGDAAGNTTESLPSWSLCPCVIDVSWLTCFVSVLGPVRWLPLSHSTNDETGAQGSSNN
jgi:hypothetical protein